MKRDIDLIRKIMLECEKHQNETLDEIKLSFDGHTPQEINYHIFLISQAEYLTITETKDSNTIPVCIPHIITWKGYEFIETVKNDTLWNRAKQLASNGSLGIIVAVVTAILQNSVLNKASIADINES